MKRCIQIFFVDKIPYCLGHNSSEQWACNACLPVTVMHLLPLTDAADDSWNSLAV